MSGHSKWSQIKRQKGVTDHRRGQLFTKLTREIMVAVRDPSEQVAVQIANTIANLFKEERDAWNSLQDKRDRIDVEIRDVARFAGVYSPNLKINVAACGVLGALIGTLIVVVMEWLETGVVRSTQDTDRLGIPALGAIPTQSSWRR